MKKVYFVIILISLIAMLSAEIGWSGNIWPNSESFNVSNEDITVYYQIWKDGVTNGAGQGDSLSAKLYYKLSTEVDYVETDMPYLGEVGNNDEYSVAIPQSYFSDNDIVNFYCEGYDASDGTYSYGTDQNDAGPFTADEPGIYYIGSPTSQDVTVTFQVDMSMVVDVLDVSVAGSFNDWTSGVNMLADPDMDDIYTGDVVFTVGSSPNQTYKFVNGTQFEDQIDNRVLIIDDSNPTQILDVVYFNNLNPEDFLSQDVTVTFNVDVSDSVNAGAVFNSLGINGNVLPLDWDFAMLTNPLTELANNIWTIDLVFPEGSWIYLEYKFAHDGNDWEGTFGENHTVTLDDSQTTMIVDCVYGEFEPVSSEPNELVQPEKYYLNNYPNPFNPTTTISFDLALEHPGSVELAIYNVKGQEVKTFEIENVSTGLHEVVWNGTDMNEQPVSSGIYFYKVSAENIVISKKMLLLK